MAEKQKPEIKKFGAMLVTNNLTEAEAIDLAMWLQDLANKVKRGQTTIGQPLRAQLNFY